MDLPWQGAPINLYIWCAIGAALGWLAGVMMGTKTRVNRIEELLVGVFGSYVGGEVMANTLAGQGTPVFSMGALAAAVRGGLVLLFLLKVMRGAVGPLRNSRGPGDRRR